MGDEAGQVSQPQITEAHPCRGKKFDYAQGTNTSYRKFLSRRMADLGSGLINLVLLSKCLKVFELHAICVFWV